MVFVTTTTTHILVRASIAACAIKLVVCTGLKVASLIILALCYNLGVTCLDFKHRGSTLWDVFIDILWTFWTF